MSNEAFSFKVGDFNCLALRDTDWVNVLYIDTGERRVLVDTGCGDTLAPPGLLMERMQAAGVSPTDIDVAIMSHADGDHIGGAATASGKPAFPTARYVLSREEWDFWESRPVRLRQELNAFFDETFFRWSLETPILRWAQLRDRLELIEFGNEIVPGIRAIAAPGHTPGMIAVSVSSDKEKLLFTGDVIYGADLSAEPGNALIAASGGAWHAFVDMDPAQALVTRERLFDHAARQRALLMVPHLPSHGMGYVSSDGHAWRWQAHHTDAR